MENIIKKECDGETIEFEGIKLKIPEDFRVYYDKGIKVAEYGRSGELIGFKTLSYEPVIIKSILINKDTETEKLELVSLETNKSLIVQKSELFSNGKIIKLADKGMQVNSNNSKAWVEYFSNLEALNKNIIPRKITVSRLGWIDQYTFIPYEKGNYELDINDNTLTWVNDLKEEGSLIEWVKTVAKLRKNYIGRFNIAASFSAPLLKITGTRSFVIYNWAGSKGGKTACAYVSMSVWGIAENLKVSFDATRVGIEGLSKIFADMPILIDEKQIDKNQNKTEEIVYMFANGKSKLRGTQNGGVQQNSKWRALAISTGEEPLSTSKSQDGVRTRVLEIYGKPIDDESVASSMYEFTQKNYGIVGKAFIKLLIKNHSQNNYSEIKRLYEEVKEKIKERCPNINYAQLSYITLVTTADVLIGEMFFKTDMESSLKMAEKIIENISKTAGKDVVDNAYSFISDWVLSNSVKFDVRTIKKQYEEDTTASEIVLNESRAYERLGLYENGIYYIWPTKFEQKLEQWGFNSEKVKQGFKERGYIVTDTETDTTVSIIYKGEKRSFIGLKLNSTHEVNEVQIEELDKNNVEVGELYPKIPTIEELGIKG